MADAAAPPKTDVEVEGTPLSYRTWGAADGAPVLYLHHLGVAGASRHPHEVASALASRGYRVVAPDQPGFGGTPPLAAPERYRLDELAGLHLGLLDALGIERAALVGFSWGGSVSVHLAARAPERVAALVLLDAGHVDAGADGSPPQPVEALVEEARSVIAEAYTFESVEAAVAAQRAEAVRWSEHVETSWREAFAVVDGRVVPTLAPETYAAAYWGFQERPPSRAWPALGRAGMPVLLLLAGQPAERLAAQRAAAAAFAEQVPQARLRWMQGHGHNLVAEIGEPLGDELADWLGEVGWP
jgi:pimeloyl-ACP methyl ester carboxylesterase